MARGGGTEREELNIFCCCPPTEREGGRGKEREHDGGR